MSNNPTKFYSCAEEGHSYALITGNGNNTLVGTSHGSPTAGSYLAHNNWRGCRTSGHSSATLKAPRFWVYQQSESSDVYSGWTEHECGSLATVTSSEVGWDNYRW